MKTVLNPIYTENNTKIIHNLFYDWIGWRSKELLLPDTINEAIEICNSFWEKDGLYLKKWNYSKDTIKILFKVNSNIKPTLFSQRIKGRLDHSLRKLETPIKFSRKVAFRCLGENTRDIVNKYVQKQVIKSDYVDARFKKILTDFTVFNDKVDLSQPIMMSHGRYWYNIHLVIVIADRKNPIIKKEKFDIIKKYSFIIANKKECEIAHLAIMPDHIHISLKGNPELSPNDIGFAFLNNLSFVLGYNRCWKNEFYVGSFSEYNLETLKQF